MRIPNIFIYVTCLISSTCAFSTLADETLINRNAEWSYHDSGSDLGSQWRNLSYDDSSWSSGFTEMGYGDGDESTVIDFGGNSNEKYITTYFRRHFNVNNIDQFNRLTLNLLRDDGAVVYLNGSEVHRDNMPSGSINYLTTTSAYIADADEQAFTPVTLPIGSLKSGDNILAIEIHQYNSSSSDISFNAELIANTGNGDDVNDSEVIRGPYLQQASENSIIIRWRTDRTTDSLVNIGTRPDNLDISVNDGNRTREHRVLLTDLQSDTQYYYSIGNSSKILKSGNDLFFRTSPRTGQSKSTRIWVIGDSGTANEDAEDVYRAYQTTTGNQYTDLWLMLGDNAYENGTDRDYQRAVFDFYPELLQQTPLWPTIGNHDGHSADSGNQSGPYFDIFSLPTNAEAGGVRSGTEAYYSFDYGNIHFVVLDSYETDRSSYGNMMVWLESDLQATNSDWIIAFWHHPPYTKGSHDSDWEQEHIEMRENALPILDSYGVDLVLNGHSHSYERSKLIDRHYGRSSSFSDSSHAIDRGNGRADDDGAYTKSETGLSNAGIVYVVAGASGKTSGGDLDHPAMSVSLNELGSMILNVDGSTLNAQYINERGRIRDYFTIEKHVESDDPTSSSITGVAWLDSDNDGTRTTSEDFSQGVSVELLNRSGIVISSTQSAANGSYQFDNLIAGDYQIRFSAANYVFTLDHVGNNTTDSDASSDDGITQLINLPVATRISYIDVGLIESSGTENKIINFNIVEVAAYSSQDREGEVNIEDQGSTYSLQGNRWRSSNPEGFHIKTNTLLEFDFYSNSEGEIHGIGFDENTSISDADRVFQLFGTQNWRSAIKDFNNYTSDDLGSWKTYTIPVGNYYQGENMHLVFVNDKDGGSINNTSRFRNVRVFENN